MGYVIAAPAQAVLPLYGSADLFPVRRVYCVGRNYVDHAKEMGASGREPPFFFAKPADALVPVGEGATGRIAYPTLTSDLQHEVELVVAVGRRGSSIDAGEAARYVWGYAVGVDLTRRDLQAELKSQRRPWEVSKGFDRSAPISPLRRAAGDACLAGGRIWLDVNGQARQQGDLSMMIWSVGEILAHLSRYFALAPGDLVFAGTPAGVAALVPGDKVFAGVDGVGDLKFEIVN
jgi:fumarylpyruvate hydrolase